MSPRALSWMVSLLVMTSSAVFGAAGSPDQLTGCIDRAGKISKLQAGSRPQGGTCPSGTTVHHLRTLVQGAHAFAGAMSLGTPVAFRLSIPFDDLFGNDPFRGEVDFATHGPLTISFGTFQSNDTLQWVRIRSTAGFLVLPGDNSNGGFALMPDDAEFEDEFVIGGNVDERDVVVERAYFLDSGAHSIKIDVSWFRAARAFVELTFFSASGDQPKLLSYNRKNVHDVTVDDIPHRCFQSVVLCSDLWR